MRRSFSRLAAFAALFLAACLGVRAWTASGVQADADVVYGQRAGAPLTLDVFRPEHPSGAGLLYMQSGNWFSVRVPPLLMQPIFQPFLMRGVTVFEVRHTSAPTTTIAEIVADVRRSARFVHLHARDYGVDPERLGVAGISSGGHLALVLATLGDDGDPRADDPVLRQPSRVAAAVALSPPTDLRDWIVHPPEALRALPAVRPRLAIDGAEAAECSPVVHVSERTPPTLLIHGDRDELVPIEQSQRMLKALRAKGVKSELITVAGAGHALQIGTRPELVRAFVAWLVDNLGGSAPPGQRS